MNLFSRLKPAALLLAAATLPVSCDNILGDLFGEDEDGPSLSEIYFEYPYYVLSGEEMAITLSGKVYDATLHFNDREIYAGTSHRMPNGEQEELRIVIPDDMRGEYTFSIVGKASEEGEITSTPDRTLSVYKLTGENYSTEPPCRVNTDNAGLIVKNIKVTKSGIEKLQFTDADGKTVQGEFEVSKAISDKYSYAVVKYFSSYTVNYTDQTDYTAWLEPSYYEYMPVIMRNSDGTLSEFYEAVENASYVQSVCECDDQSFYFIKSKGYSDPDKYICRADLYDDGIGNIHTVVKEFKSTAGKIEDADALYAGSDGIVHVNKSAVISNGIVYDMYGIDYEPGSVCAFGKNIIAYAYTGLYYPVFYGGNSGEWVKIPGSEGISPKAYATLNGTLYILCDGDTYYTLDSQYNISAHKYVSAVSSIWLITYPQWSVDEEYIYFIDNMKLCRWKLSEMETSLPEPVYELYSAANMMFLSNYGKAAWGDEDSDFNHMRFSLFDGNEVYTFTDKENIFDKFSMNIKDGILLNNF